MTIYKKSFKNKKTRYPLQSFKRKISHELNYTKTNDHQKNKKTCQNIIDKSSYPRMLSYIKEDDIFPKPKAIFNTNKNVFDLNKYRYTKFFTINYVQKCLHDCSKCKKDIENYHNKDERICHKKKKKKHYPFYLYQQNKELYLMVFYNQDSPYIIYEILEKWFEFMDYYGKDLKISKSHVYNVKTKKLVKISFAKAFKQVSNYNNNPYLLSQLTSYNYERYIIFLDTEGRKTLKEVGYYIYDIHKEEVIEEEDSRNTNVKETIFKLNKLISKNNDIVICAHNTDHDANVLNDHGLLFNQTTKFCCSSRNNNFKDLDQLCKYFNVPNEEPRHIAIVDAKLLLQCFLKSTNQFKIKFLKNIRNYPVP